MTEYESDFNVELKYKTEKDLHMENILWTVRVSAIIIDLLIIVSPSGGILLMLFRFN